MTVKSIPNNVFGVPTKTWRKWLPRSRKMFNELYTAMTDSPWAFKSPKTQEDKHWKTTAWNTAWIAADLVRDDNAAN